MIEKLKIDKRFMEDFKGTAEQYTISESLMASDVDYLEKGINNLIYELKLQLNFNWKVAIVQHGIILYIKANELDGADPLNKPKPNKIENVKDNSNAQNLQESYINIETDLVSHAEGPSEDTYTDEPPIHNGIENLHPEDCKPNVLPSIDAQDRENASEDVSTVSNSLLPLATTHISDIAETPTNLGIHSNDSKLKMVQSIVMRNETGLSLPCMLSDSDLCYNCYWCPRKFLRRLSFMHHKEKDHGYLKNIKIKEVRLQRSDKQIKRDRSFECRLCPEIFASEVLLRHHFLTHRSCYICGKKFPFQIATIKHELREHGLQQLVRSYKYPKPNTLSDETQLKQKRKYQKKNIKINCPFCLKRCSSEEAHSHMDTHRIAGDITRDSEIEKILSTCPKQVVKTDFPCLSCGEKFNTREDFNEHYKIHKTCELCLLVCDKVKELRKHMKEVHGKFMAFVPGSKKLSCEICGRLFAHEYQLKNHKAEQHNEESAKCHICGSQLKSKMRLKAHLKFIHSDERKFPCFYCHKSFKSPQNRHQHHRQHKPKQYKCVCGLGFTYPHGLRKHQESCLSV